MFSCIARTLGRLLPRVVALCARVGGELFPAYCVAVPLIAAVALCACGEGGSQPQAGGRSCPMTTADGVKLGATLYPVQGAKPPGLILVHMLGSERRTWEAFALQAQRKGYACLAFDLRGHGESTTRNGATIAYRTFKTQDWLEAVNDIDAAKKALIENGADPENLAVAGASIGANLALIYALDHKDIAAVVLISPGLEYHGVKTQQAAADYGKRPLLLLDTEGDSYSAASCATLKRNASGLCELREYHGSAHGNDLLDTTPAAIEQILLWLKPIIGPKP